MGVKGIQLYMKNLFSTLAYLHSLGITHRDIKPANFLYNPSEGSFLLIDFGLASEMEMQSKAGTKGFRAPEALLKCATQTKVDMWSAGIILLSMLSGRYPFFYPSDDISELVQIMSVCGVEEIQNAVQNQGKRIIVSESVAKQLERGWKGWKELCEKANPKGSFVYPDSVYSLLGGLLEPDPSKRLSAEEALNHPFFKEN